MEIDCCCKPHNGIIKPVLCNLMDRTILSAYDDSRQAFDVKAIDQRCNKTQTKAAVDRDVKNSSLPVEVTT